VHEAILEVARAFVAGRERAPFLVNSVLAPDGSLAAVFAGDLFQAFTEGAAYVNAHFARPVRKPFDLAIASAGGHPRDATLYQAHKAFDHAARAVRDGGVVVLGAACGDGAGAGFLDWFRYESYEEHLRALERGFAVPGQTALALRQKLARVKGVLVSRLESRDVEATGLVPRRSLSAALSEARKLLAVGGETRIRACVIPHAALLRVERPLPVTRRRKRR
jgi:nickel-dependent lactate racemase